MPKVELPKVEVPNLADITREITTAHTSAATNDRGCRTPPTSAAVTARKAAARVGAAQATSVSDQSRVPPTTRATATSSRRAATG